nr:Mur ligase domain-containing protein [Bdellovibrionales bacterium]
MKLSTLLSVFPQLRLGDFAHQDVQKLTQDSRQVAPGTVFVAIRGATGDGHEFLAQVAREGAIALIVEDDQGVPKDFRG